MEGKLSERGVDFSSCFLKLEGPHTSFFFFLFHYALGKAEEEAVGAVKKVWCQRAIKRASLLAFLWQKRYKRKLGSEGGSGLKKGRRKGTYID